MDDTEPTETRLLPAAETRKGTGSSDSKPERLDRGRFAPGNTISKLGGRPRDGERKTLPQIVQALPEKVNQDLADVLVKQGLAGKVGAITAIAEIQKQAPQADNAILRELLESADRIFGPVVDAEVRELDNE